MRFHKQLIIIHTVLAAFFLPMGIMYAITGGLYGLGITGGYHTTQTTIQLQAPLNGELSTMVALAEAELARAGVAPHSGGASIKTGGTSYFLEWTGTQRDVQLHPTNDPLIATFKLRETGTHRYFVQLHKAKGGTLFKWFAAVWMVGLVALFLTGGVMAFMAKPYRRLAAITAVTGVVVFACMAFLS